MNPNLTEYDTGPTCTPDDDRDGESKISRLLRAARTNVADLADASQARAIRALIEGTERAAETIPQHARIADACQEAWMNLPARDENQPLQLRIESTVTETGSFKLSWVPILSGYEARRTFQSLLAFNHGPKANCMELRHFHEVRLTLQRLSLHRRLEDTSAILATRYSLWACTCLPDLLLTALTSRFDADIAKELSVGYGGDLSEVDPQFHHRETLVRWIADHEETATIPLEALVDAAMAGTSAVTLREQLKERFGACPSVTELQAHLRAVRAILSYNSFNLRRYAKIEVQSPGFSVDNYTSTG